MQSATETSDPGQLDTAPPETALAVQREQLQLMLAHMAFGTPIAAAFAVVFAAFLSGHLAPTVLATWLTGKLLIAAARMVHARSLRQSEAPHSTRDERVTLGLLFADGLWWGVAGIWIATLPADVAAIVIASLVSVACVAAFGLQVRLAATTLCVVPLLLPAAIAVLFRTDAIAWFASAGLVLLLGLMLISARNSERRLAEVFRLRHLMSRLSAELEQALRASQTRLQRADQESALREQQARIEAMQEAVQARSAFLSKVSHELRSPLQSIVSALDVFEMRHGHGMAGDDELIARMRRSSMLLNTQLRDLLTLAKGQSGRLELRPEPFEACSLAEGVALASREGAREKGLVLDLELPPEPIFAVADAARIDQILTNLVNNAIRYTETGRIRLLVRPYDGAHKRLVFTVSDTGPGIPEDRLATLLEPQSALPSSGSTLQGSGIGLAVVRTLVEHLGGSVRVRSRIGEGTRFDVEIPAELIDERQPGAGTRNSRRVLVVDDNPDVLIALTSVVHELGYDCDRASTADSARQLLSAGEYAAVLIDLDMPHTSGAQLAAEVRGRHGANHATRILGISAAEVASPRADDPFDGYLSKPIDRNALVSALRDEWPETWPPSNF